MRVRITEDEYFPFREVREIEGEPDSSDVIIDVSKEQLAEYRRVMREFNDMQGELKRRIDRYWANVDGS